MGATDGPSATKAAQVRLNRVTPSHCRVVLDNPPLNLMGPEFVSGVSVRPEVAVPDHSAVTRARWRALEQPGEVAVRQALGDVAGDMCLAFG
jgi:hypothetical protein